MRDGLPPLMHGGACAGRHIRFSIRLFLRPPAGSVFLCFLPVCPFAASLPV